MSLVKAFATITARGLEGAAKAAKAQDEIENEWATIGVTTTIKKIEEIKKNALENAKEEREKNSEINSLHGTVYGTDKATGNKRMLSRAEIGQLIGSIGKDKLIEFAMEDDRLEILGGTATAIKTEVDTGAKDLLSATTEAIPTGQKGIAEGQAGRVSKQLASRLSQLGYDMESVPTTTGTTTYAGGQFVISPETTDLSTKQDTSYVVNKDGKFTGQVVYTVTKVDKTAGGVPIIKHFDFEGNELKLPEGTNLVDSAAAVKLFSADENFPKKAGVLYTFDEKGRSVAVKGEGDKPLFGYRMKDGTLRLQVAGKPSENVFQRDDVLVGTAEDLGSAQFDLLKRGEEITNFPAWTEYTKRRTEAEDLQTSLDTERNIILQRVSILSEYGNKIYGPEAAFASFVVTAKKTITGVANIVEQLAGLEYDEAGIVISQNQAELQNAVNDRDSILSKIGDENDRIATAAVLDAAAASLQAYSKGKAAGEDRMTDRDFAVFKSTIKGNTASQTLALLQQSFETTLTNYDGAYRNLTYRYEDLQSLSDDIITPEFKSLSKTQYERLKLPSQYKIEVTSAIDAARENISGEAPTETLVQTREIPSSKQLQGKDVTVVVKGIGNDRVIQLKVEGQVLPRELSLQQALNLGYLTPESLNQ